jgi:hypothetical protein
MVKFEELNISVFRETNWSPADLVNWKWQVKQGK